MFIRISVYQAKEQEEDAVIALHEFWQRNESGQVSGYVSGELLKSQETPRLFLEIERFENRAAALALSQNREHANWLMRLLSLTEARCAIPTRTTAWETICIELPRKED